MGARESDRVTLSFQKIVTFSFIYILRSLFCWHIFHGRSSRW